MHPKYFTIVLSTVAGIVTAGPVKKRDLCSSYTLLVTRGTTQHQDRNCTAFEAMNTNIFAQVPGGKLYNTVYPAADNQSSGEGTADIVRYVNATLFSNPDECFILQGYSQGAAATVDALPKLKEAALDNAIKGVFLLGNPRHKKNLPCNVDNNGGETTMKARGVESFTNATIPREWVTKSKDVCIEGDSVCDFTNPKSVKKQHLMYPNDTGTQNMGAEFAIAMLQGSSQANSGYFDRFFSFLA